MKTDVLRVKRAAPIETEITVPGDPGISHRALLVAALSNGVCSLGNIRESADCLRTENVLRQLGIRIDRPDDGLVVVHGSRGRFTAPEEAVDCGESGETRDLLIGVLAGQPFVSRLTGEASLSRHPTEPILEALVQMGAKITPEGTGESAPLHIEGRPLRAITYRAPVASARVKSAILLAGLSAGGVTTVIEPAFSRDHTEYMLEYFLVKLRREEVRKEKIGRPSECRASLLGGQRLESRDFTVPGDISSAAYWLVAAAAQPGSRLLIKNVGLNPARTAPLDVLLRMGARVREVVETPDHNEPCGVIDLKGAPLHGTVIEGAEIPHLIDELPLLAVAGALAQGETIIRDAGALRTKEIDRIAAVADNLRALGVEVEEFDDGLRILGGAKLKGTKLSSHGDARIAKAFAIAGLFATGETVIENAACVRTAYSGFDITLKHIQKGNSLLQRRTPVISSLNGGRKRRKR